MPITRKLVDIGNARGITLPADWLKIVEKQLNGKIEAIAIEVNSVLTLTPVHPETGLPVSHSNDIIVTECLHCLNYMENHCPGQSQVCAYWKNKEGTETKNGNVNKRAEKPR